MRSEILQGDALAMLKTLPEKSVHTCVTSPPYYGLRDYVVEGQIGLEDSPAAYVARLVAVFAEVRRVLKDDGTLWLNIGDSYASSGTQDPGGHKGLSAASERYDGRSRNAKNKAAQNGSIAKVSRTLSPGLKPKDLIGIPWLLAFTLRADGWYLRQEIIWHKPNPMPESVTDRCTKAHESLFLLAKSERYFYDADAIAEAISESTVAWGGGKAGCGKSNANHSTPSGTHGPSLRGDGRCGERADGKRNKRSVWTVPTRSYKEAHFAVFPPDLIKPCILAGAPEGGTVLDCFAGSGTTLWTANSLCRNALGIELNAEYVKLIQKRLAQGFLDWTQEEETEL